MRSLKDQFPRVLLGKHQLVMTVLFAAFFSLLFLLVSIPFSHNAWFNLGRSEAFWFTVVFFVFSLAIVSFSKVGLYMLRETANFTVLHYVLWNTVEILLIAVIYSFFTIEGDRFGIIDLHNMQFWRLFLSAVVYGVISLGVPYIIAALYFMRKTSITSSIIRFSKNTRDGSRTRISKRMPDFKSSASAIPPLGHVI